MIIGHDTLIEMFPNFTEDIGENGIDLRVGEIYTIQKHNNEKIGCINDEKLPPNYTKMESSGEDHYTLQPQQFYFIKIDRPIHIPHGYCQNYYLRSTFSRCGLILTDAVGDDGFSGTLMLGIYNSSPLEVYMGLNERVIQAITIKNDGTATEYDGSYQNDKLYKQKENLEK